MLFSKPPRPATYSSAILVLLAASACGSGTDSSTTSGGDTLVNQDFLLGGESPIGGALPGDTEPQFAACAGTVSQGEKQSTDMFVMLDHTGSMGNDCPLNLDRPVGRNGSKWCYATHAFGRYFTSTASVGSRVALQFMSGEDFVCDGGANNGAASAAVPMTALPVDEEHPLITTLDLDNPIGGLGTQIEAALHGIADYTRENEVRGRTMVGVLVTDGDPSGCEEDIDDLAGIIEAHLRDTGIRTFIVGMTGASLNNLERLARAGGAPEHGREFCGGQRDCHFWSVGDGDPEAFANALGQIESAAAVPCSYVIPRPPNGATLNPNLVNIQFKPVGTPAELIRRVDTCDSQGGWFYDDPVDPAVLQLCPVTCQQVVDQGEEALVDIAYGCQSALR